MTDQMAPSNAAGLAPLPLNFLKDTHSHLHNMIRSISRKRFADITSRKNLVIVDHDRPDDFLYGAHLAVIQIAAKDIRITFKSHFNLTEVTTLTQRNPEAEDERTNAQILKATYDLFKEYSNLVAGGISQQLHGVGVYAGISLPIATSGFDELISSDEYRPTRLYDFWRIVGEDFSYICSVYAEIFETAKLDSYTYEEVPYEDEGSIIEIL
jgi:hypothetical protein